MHGFRSTFADWAHERTGANGMIVEMCLAHTVGSDVERSLSAHGSVRSSARKLMDAWATFATAPAVAGAVVPLRAR